MENIYGFVVTHPGTVMHERNFPNLCGTLLSTALRAGIFLGKLTRRVSCCLSIARNSLARTLDPRISTYRLHFVYHVRAATRIILWIV